MWVVVIINITVFTFNISAKENVYILINRE